MSLVDMQQAWLMGMPGLTERPDDPFENWWASFVAMRSSSHWHDPTNQEVAKIKEIAKMGFEAAQKVVCGTTNCSKCGRAAPTSTGICDACHDEARLPMSLRTRIEDRITEWDLPMETLKLREKELEEQLEQVRSEMRRRELVLGELRSLLHPNT